MERIICAIDAGKRLEDVQINVLDALRIIQDAWCHVSSDTIRNCFRHCGFSSEVNPDLSEEPAAAEVESFLGTFADLQDRNVIDEEIDPEDFLHVDEDEPTSAISTDEEIVECIRNKTTESDDEENSDD